MRGLHLDILVDALDAAEDIECWVFALPINDHAHIMNFLKKERKIRKKNCVYIINYKKITSIVLAKGVTVARHRGHWSE